MVAAARDLTAAHGWDGVRMADVAAAVGVSRQTVYNEFGDRAGLAEQLALAEVQRFAEMVGRELSAHGDDVHAAVHATIQRVLTEAAANPLVRAILTGDRGGGELMPYLTTRSNIVLHAAGEVVAGWVRVQRPELDDGAAAAAADVIIRLVISHIVMPGESSAASAEALSGVFMRLLG
ncbi:TetR/AcrR family transcriptional regulator [Paractinoplanes abujensis]|uniref:AcrR family transcriptional regulator n=1 Tax=Paractinoplanes abujensis TaxID=882441 RepID=A0A7W7G449_9ACTN|nr:TetR family transcriptional regulator [Actinoplanes abujensis]MBB4693431.1 AcrR family transcriptional regulator [Actinoplanes abujensis]